MTTLIRPNARALRAAREVPWAILPAKLAEITELLHMHAAGLRLSPEAVQEIVAQRGEAKRAQTAGTVAVLPLQGTLVPRADIMTEYSGGTSLEKFKGFFRTALADPNVSGIVLDIDSPGGSVYGVEEAAQEVYRARGQKPIVAFANPMAASAAYWIGAQADELVVTPSGEVGSIGVLALHEDWSRAYDAAGVTPTFISAGKFKTEGNEMEPLGEDAKAALQARVDDYYGAFVRAVAKGHGKQASDVRSGFGEGRLVGAAEAVKLGMADQEGTIEDAIARASRPAASKRAEGASVAVMQKQIELWEASAPN